MSSIGTLLASPPATDDRFYLKSSDLRKPDVERMLKKWMLGACSDSFRAEVPGAAKKILRGAHRAMNGRGIVRFSERVNRVCLLLILVSGLAHVTGLGRTVCDTLIDVYDVCSITPVAVTLELPTHHFFQWCLWVVAFMIIGCILQILKVNERASRLRKFVRGSNRNIFGANNAADHGIGRPHVLSKHREEAEEEMKKKNRESLHAASASESGLECGILIVSYYAHSAQAPQMVSIVHETVLCVQRSGPDRIIERDSLSRKGWSRFPVKFENQLGGLIEGPSFASLQSGVWSREGTQKEAGSASKSGSWSIPRLPSSNNGTSVAPLPIHESFAIGKAREKFGKRSLTDEFNDLYFDSEGEGTWLLIIIARKHALSPKEYMQISDALPEIMTLSAGGSKIGKSSSHNTSGGVAK
eukprot:TRINITY_DN1083_c0_g1_i1.p1 TRINITY_DN1083_c0_g1~~TRINITY_DN1083_c0_g1_i1.p1  ORF type:complete len:449 (-),score=25.32 TRINITY_DN1083_c0_g1_i1:1510-2748(-)